ncbi:MAG: FtsW/RodA/SpoVE family cell cycle protein [Hydrotalea sp.]|nr:FtsW/RodA/SpoVE family cell cycle protein [Hydrotalea sp.]
MDRLLFTRADKSPLARWWWSVDIVTLVLVFCLMAVGLLAVSSSMANPTTPSSVFIKHVIFVALGMVTMVGTSFLSPRQVKALSGLIFFIAIMLMILILVRGGQETKGAKRWFPLFGLALQPSEFIKPALAVLFANFFVLAKREKQYFFYGLGLLILLLVIGLLLLQPDVGMTALVGLTFLSIMFLAGTRLRFILPLLLGMALVGIAAYYIFPHVQERILHTNDYQIKKSMAAFTSGGFLGTGLGTGVVKLTLPDVHTDFIFALLGEELGLIPTLGLLGVYVVIILKSFKRLYESKNDFRIIAGGGLICQFGFAILINLFSVLGLGPTKGLTLPFISYGGSAMLSAAITMGFLLALTRQKNDA